MVGIPFGFVLNDTLSDAFGVFYCIGPDHPATDDIGFLYFPRYERQHESSTGCSEPYMRRVLFVLLPRVVVNSSFFHLFYRVRIELHRAKVFCDILNL